ncbi:MAG: type II toxin-antitoxin system VapB family antitoxin [Thermodesulfovibrionales bacterium]
MATNLDLDDKLLEEARIVGKHKTKNAVINEALMEYIQRRKQADIIELFHNIDYEPGYNYKKQRKKH